MTEIQCPRQKLRSVPQYLLWMKKVARYDSDLLKWFRYTKLCKDFKLNCRKAKSHNVPQLVLSKNKWFREFLVRCGVEKGENKHISERLMTMNLENTSWLLKGLFDTDGCVEKSRKVSFCNISEKLIKQIQKLLLRYGIVTSIRTKPASSM